VGIESGFWGRGVEGVDYELEVCSYGDERWGVLVAEVSPTCCYCTDDFDVVVGDPWPADLDYCFKDLECL
jgi:hypothetical protein